MKTYAIPILVLAAMLLIGGFWWYQRAPDEPLVTIPTGGEDQTTGCMVTGCSGTVCAEPDAEPVVTTCEFKPHYACYRQAVCERQTNGTCGWTETVGFTTCLDRVSRGSR